MSAVIKRREFITLLGGAAAAWPLVARAQQAGKLPAVGVLASGTPSSHGRWVATFVRRLRELGWIEGRTVAIEVRWAEGRSDHAAEIAADFVRLKVDAVVTTGTPTTLAAKQATAVIPIVFVAASDPVAGNLVASLARPGGNMTGLSNQQRDLAGKRLELLREVLPGLRRLAILVNVGNSAAVAEMGEVQAAAGTHPDLIVAGRPEGKNEVPIDVVRELCRSLALKSSRGRGKVAILDDADDLNPYSANSFLKTLEEPPAGSVLILIGTSSDLQLPPWAPSATCSISGPSWRRMNSRAASSPPSR